MPAAPPSTGTDTRIVVSAQGGRHRFRTSPGILRAQRLHGPDDRVRVALVGQTALLLGGDDVVLDVDVGPGARLELRDIAGTVAYHGRGATASWRTRIRVAAGARVDYRGEPFVLSDGADVRRSLEVDLAHAAVAVLTETVVFGRSGELGGRLDTTTVLRRAGVEFCREHWRSDAAARSRPGVFAGAKRLDSVLALGTAGAGGGQVLQLLDPGSTLSRTFSGERAPRRPGPGAAGR